MTDITELAQRMRIAATMASQGAWSYARSGFNSIVRTSANLPSGGASRVVLCKLFRSEWRGELKTAQDAQFIALANPANVLALVEELEKAQTKAIEQGRTACELFDEVTALRQRIAELEPRIVKLPDDEDGQAYGFGKWANGKLPATAGTMTIAYCEDAWRAAFEVFSSAAGIKVEAE